MDVPPVLRQTLVFALDELGSRNGQHDFELICQEVARGRLASNLITATGPVAALGDQGRDGETDWSYLPGELGPHGIFLARVSDAAAAFCCTVQQDDLTRKFLDDARKVVATGQPVERIYAFCTARVPVGHRHRLEHAITAEIKLPVTLFDGNWVAEQLAQSDLFWVAERYLDIPSHLRPTPDQRDPDAVPDWYEGIRSHWRARSEAARTEGDFHHLRRGLREAIEPGPARADLPLWISRMRELLQHGEERVHQRVRFELGIAHGLALRDLRPVDDLVRAYFASLDRESEVFRLFDGSSLAVLTAELSDAGRSGVHADELDGWRELLARRYAELLAEEPLPTRRSYLWFGAGAIAIQSMQPEIRSRAVDAWHNTLDGVGEDSIFPTDQLGDALAATASVLAGVPGWPELTARFDEVSARVAGRGAAAANAYRRARALHEAGRVRLAIAELHRARVEWYGGESLFESIQASLGLAQSYGQLGLMHACKQFALSAAFIAEASGRDHVRDMIPAGLELAAAADFVCGRWLSALPLLTSRLLAIGETTSSEFDRAVHTETTLPVRSLARIVAAARDLDPALDEAVSGALQGKSFQGVRAMIDDRVPTRSREEWEQEAAANLHGPMFADADSRVRLTSSMLGLDWCVETDARDPAAVLAAGRLMALAEVLLVDLSEHDLCLMPGVVELQVRVEGSATPDEPAPDAEAEPAGGWDVELMPHARIEQLNASLAEALGAIMAAVSLRSLLPDAELRRLATDAMQRGLPVRLVAGRTFDEVATYGAGGIFVTPPSPPFEQKAVPPPEPHPELAWQSGPGPGYSRERAEAMLRDWYPRAVELVPRTLERLASDVAFAAVLEELRAAGWRDWHLLQAVVAVATKSDDAPLNRFTLEAMHLGRRVNLLAVVRAWDLELSVEEPDWRALERVLAERYGYWADDVPHDDPFTR